MKKVNLKRKRPSICSDDEQFCEKFKKFIKDEMKEIEIEKNNEISRIENESTTLLSSIVEREHMLKNEIEVFYSKRQSKLSKILKDSSVLENFPSVESGDISSILKSNLKLIKDDFLNLLENTLTDQIFFVKSDINNRLAIGSVLTKLDRKVKFEYPLVKVKSFDSGIYAFYSASYRNTHLASMYKEQYMISDSTVSDKDFIFCMNIETGEIINDRIKMLSIIDIEISKDIYYLSNDCIDIKNFDQNIDNIYSIANYNHSYGCVRRNDNSPIFLANFKIYCGDECVNRNPMVDIIFSSNKAFSVGEDQRVYRNVVNSLSQIRIETKIKNPTIDNLLDNILKNGEKLLFDSKNIYSIDEKSLKVAIFLQEDLFGDFIALGYRPFCHESVTFVLFHPANIKEINLKNYKLKSLINANKG
ncbi:DgyrCDS3684 [Dimorphilus gyrociliatus]|uniref:DgyrCDS3684 n=1 Tax=Dimorphilus gyrociliatus TaxID=2664684 RepID=A0A7I8VJ55_9ANNE|nr:DgyrCDS3684 [Dimorphilus gyrociliatus]